MSLETAVYINTLDPNQPAGDDPVAQADDHLRMIKLALKQTFPNITGPVTASQGAINGYTVPAGGIILWSGSFASIPAGWALCNGGNGTPNLQDRFIVGAGSGYGVGAQGGANIVATAAAGAHGHSTDVQGSHSHGGVTAPTILTLDQIPAHRHNIVVNTYTESGAGAIASGGFQGFDGNVNTVTEYAGSDQGHSHGVYTDGAHGHNISYVGDHTHTVDTRSPYYALAYIMKL